MRIIAVFITLLLWGSNAFAGELYTRSFGNPGNPPVIFLHGGPGSDCFNFEYSTAQALANNGFFVVVYDRRGEGRSTADSALFTFQQTFDDLENIYAAHSIEKATLIGHSFGGVVATRYAEQHPHRVQSLILVGAPITLQETFKHILSAARKTYTAKNDTAGLKVLHSIEQMDSASMFYVSACFRLAISNGAYKPQNATAEAIDLYKGLKSDTLSKPAPTFRAPMGFLQNEKFSTIDLQPHLEQLAKKVKIYGLYGKDDGLYPPAEIDKLKNTIGAQNVLYLDNCSHNVFIDQQDAFITAVKKWVE